MNPVLSFSEIDTYISNVIQKTLILVDVDSTLIIPLNPLLHPQAFSSYKHVVRKLYESITPEQKHFVNHSIVAQGARLIEDSSVAFIKKMQTQRIPILAITASKTRLFENSSKEFHRIRFEQLKQLGIDFSIHTLPDKEFRSLSPTYGDYPALINGIIYSCGLNNSKGDVVREVLKTYPDFNQVVIIDDKTKHLESISNVFQEDFKPLNLIAFHYKGADLLRPHTLVSEQEFQEYLSSLIEKTKQIDWL